MWNKIFLNASSYIRCLFNLTHYLIGRNILKKVFIANTDIFQLFLLKKLFNPYDFLQAVRFNPPWQKYYPK